MNTETVPITHTAVDEGYRAQAQGKVMSLDNPYKSSEPAHWEWRKGFVEAFNDSH